MNIICVIVTYNRKELLQRCLNSVLNEEFRQDQIILIDNASNDWTEQVINNGYQWKLLYRRLNENIGWAGWFHEGFKMAYDNWADAILVFDDDVEMLPWSKGIYERYSDKADIVIWRKKNLDESDFEFWHNINPKNGKLKKITKFDKDLFLENDFIEMNTITFEWVLIHRGVIEKIWFPEKEFFIQWDDAWFWLKAYLSGFKIIYIKDYTFVRLLWEHVDIIFWRKMEKIKAFSLYYQIRNKFLLNKFLNASLDKKVDHTLSILTFSWLVFVYILLTQNNKITLLSSLFNWLKDWFLWKNGK